MNRRRSPNVKGSARSAPAAKLKPSAPAEREDDDTLTPEEIKFIDFIAELIVREAVEEARRAG